MRAARLIARLPPASGGKEIHGAELTRVLASRGVEQHVFCRVGDRVSSDIQQSSPPYLGGRGRLDMAVFALWAGQAIRREHALRPFDIIHVHGDYVEALVAARLSGRLAIPAVLTIHGDFKPDPLRSFLRRSAFAGMHEIWSVSQTTARAISDLGVRIPTRVHPSGVREAFFRPRDPRAEAGPVVAVGRLAAVKGLEYLIAAHDHVSAEEGRQWIVAATGQGGYADGIRAEINRRPGIELVSFSSAEPLAQLLSRTAVFVLPSVDQVRMQEGVPTALLEAIAASVPVVATRTGGVAEFLEDGVTALLVPPGDSGALADAIRATLRNSAEAAARAARAREAELARPWARVAERALEVYEAAIVEPTGGVLIVIPRTGIGKEERRVADHANGIAARGVPVTIAAPPGDIVRALDPAVGFQPLQRGRRPAAFLSNTGVLMGLLIRLRPGSVISHSLGMRLAVRVAMALSGRRGRHILTRHRRAWLS